MKSKIVTSCQRAAILVFGASVIAACDGDPPSGSGTTSSSSSSSTGGVGGKGAGGSEGTGGAGGSVGVGGSGGAAASCGDGSRASGEDCDGADLGGATCTSALGVIATGKLACGAGCIGLDVSGCAPVSATTVTVGLEHVCVLLNDDSVKCWGGNFFGQVGVGDKADHGDQPGEMGALLAAVDLGAGRRATSLANGAVSSCALLDNQAVKCWGDNAQGQLGLGDTLNRGDAAGEMGDTLPAVDLGAGKKAIAISAGAAHECAILQDNTVKCWGNGGEGKLGLGDTNNRGDQPGEMGDALPTVNLGTGRTAVAIAAGNAHTCAILDNSTVKCWGNNGSGQLGLGDTAHRGDQAGEMGDALPAVDLGAGHTAIAIAAGEARTCAILNDNTLKCWGNNGSGALGLGDSANRGDQAGEMGDSLPAINLGTGRTAKTIAVGRHHNCALLDDASVKCWGDSPNGELGLGDVTTRGDGPGEMGDALPAVDLGAGRTALAVATAYDIACARLDNGGVKCWGKNQYGGLGEGDVLSKGDGPGEMGDNLAPVRVVASQRVRNGFVASDGSQSFSQTCDFSPTTTLDCNTMTFPISAFPLPPASITLDAGTFVIDRYGAAFWAGSKQKILLGYLQSDGAKEWTQTCDIAVGGAIQCDPAVQPALQASPPKGLSLPQGKTIGGRFMFVYRQNGVQKLRNGFVQSDGAQSFSQTCDIFDGVIDCDAATHPFSAFPVPAGVTPANGTYVGDRYTFVYIVDGAQKLRNGFVQSDGAQSFSQTCDIAADGALTCGAMFNAFALPPPTLPPGTVVNHRFTFTYQQ